MAPHSSTLAWKTSWTEESGRLQSMGSLRVGHDWALHFHFSLSCIGEGNGNPLQYSCLENSMDGEAWWATVHGIAKSRIWLSDFTLTFHFHAWEKEMATHSSVLAWRIPRTEEPGGLQSMGSRRVGHDWETVTFTLESQLYLDFQDIPPGWSHPVLWLQPSPCRRGWLPNRYQTSPDISKSHALWVSFNLYQQVT